MHSFIARLRQGAGFGRIGALNVLRFAVAIGLIGWMLWWLDGGQALALLGSADPFWLFAALLALTVQTLLLALRWKLTAARLGQILGYGHAVREYYLAQIVNQAVPGGVVGDAGRAVRARGEVGLWRATQAVALERLAGQAALIGVLIPALVITLLLPGGIDWPGQTAGMALAIVAGAVAIVAAILAARRLPGRSGRMMTEGVAAVQTAFLAPSVRWRQAALGVSIVGCNLTAFAACALATGTDLPLAAVLALVPLILLSMLVPLTVSGWGVREGAAAALFPLAGASPESGLAASIAFGLAVLVASAPGIVTLVAGRRGDASESTADDDLPLAHGAPVLSVQQRSPS